jgi:hypothetical protein
VPAGDALPIRRRQTWNLDLRPPSCPLVLAASILNAAQQTVLSCAHVQRRLRVAAESVPVFDVARIERTGEAVIAGRAAPGATVDLLRNGERLDGAVADSSGQFAMIIPRLPMGGYELTLSARPPDGTLATSKQGVVVALAEAGSSSGVAPSRAEAVERCRDREDEGVVGGCEVFPGAPAVPASSAG